MTVKTWVCQICEDPYVGEDKPTHCPFCGAPAKYIVPADKFHKPEVKELSDASREDIFSAIKLEVDNALFYFCASKKSGGLEHQKRFHALGKVESEHATVLSKMVGAAKPVIDRSAGECSGDDKDFVKESHDRESRAIEHYKEFAARAEDPRVKQVFNALVEIETTHIELADSENN